MVKQLIVSIIDRGFSIIWKSFPYSKPPCFEESVGTLQAFMILHKFNANNLTLSMTYPDKDFEQFYLSYIY